MKCRAQRWADLGDAQHGFSLINESKYGYDGVGNVLRLTLLRSPTWPDPEADRGHHHFSYALYPHARRLEAGDDGAARIRTSTTTSRRCRWKRTPERCPRSILSSRITPENVVLTAMKKAEDSNALDLPFL